MRNLKTVSGVLFCLAFFAIVAWQPAFAYDADKHEDHLEMVILGKDVPPAKKNVDLSLLEDAAYLCIDQWSSNGESQLKNLRGNGFPFLLIPLGVSSLVPKNCPGNHRSYTHCGWSRGYYERLFIGREEDRNDWEKRWEKRKGILRDVVKRILSDESPLGWLPFASRVDGDKVECFCKLIYCVHVLGDYLHDKDGSAFTGSNRNGYKILFASAHSESDIYSELKECLEGLFKDQSKEPEYKSLMHDLNDLMDEARAFATAHEESYDTTEDYEIIYSYAEKLMALLMGSDDYFDRNYGYTEKRISKLLMMNSAFKEKFGKL